MRTVCIIQARMGSERLPGKVLRKINEKPMLGHIVQRLQTAKTLNEIVVATSVKPADDAIESYCRSLQIPVYRGSESDVLERYYSAASQYEADVVVRVTADCPLVDADGIDQLVNELMNSDLDYIAFSNDQIPRGLTGEVFLYSALQMALRDADKPYEREHVTIYLYEHPEMFKIRYMPAPAWLRHPEFRLTVDTAEDLELIRIVYREVPCVGVLNLKDVLSFLQDHPEIARINQHVVQKQPHAIADSLGLFQTRLILLKQAEKLTEQLIDALKADDDILSTELLEQRQSIFEKVTQINSSLDGQMYQLEEHKNLGKLTEEAKAIVDKILQLDQDGIEQVKQDQTLIFSELQRLREGLRARRAYRQEKAYDPRFIDKLK